MVGGGHHGEVPHVCEPRLQHSRLLVEAKRNVGEHYSLEPPFERSWRHPHGRKGKGDAVCGLQKADVGGGDGVRMVGPDRFVGPVFIGRHADCDGVAGQVDLVDVVPTSVEGSNKRVSCFCLDRSRVDNRTNYEPTHRCTVLHSIPLYEGC